MASRVFDLTKLYSEGTLLVKHFRGAKAKFKLTSDKTLLRDGRPNQTFIKASSSSLKHLLKLGPGSLPPGLTIRPKQATLKTSLQLKASLGVSAKAALNIPGPTGTPIVLL